jgi:hypothetical protein
MAEESDALSLHSIAEQADAYVAQEQEDADFALALALEEEETQRLISQNQHSPNRNDAQNMGASEALEPYRDDPDAADSVEEHANSMIPYRDDPDAEPNEPNEPTNIDESVEAGIVARLTRRRYNIPSILKTLRKVWVIAIIVSTLTIAVIIGIVLAVSLKAKEPSPRDRAWRASHSIDGDLRLPALYPSLEPGASEDCKNTWEKYALTLRCHRVILNAALDNGDVDEVKEAADPFAYLEEVCTDQCWNSINYIRNPLHNGCFRRNDGFDIITFRKSNIAYFEEGKVEEGPLHVWKNLERRYKRFCAKPPKDTYEKKSEWGTCAADLWMRWGIVDTTNEANMIGLDKFFEATSQNKTIEGGKRTGTLDLVGGKTKSYDVDVPTRRVGPGISETDCGYCTLNWLERKMRSFEYGQMLDPGTGEVLSLQEFWNRMYDAIKRCDGAYGAGSALGRVYRKWEQYGWWHDRQPSHEDVPVSSEVRSLLHGVRVHDYPLPLIRELMKGSHAPKKALQAMYDGTKNLPCSIWFDNDVSIRDVVPYQYRVHHLCSDPCRNAVDRLQKQHEQDFSAAITKSDPVYQDIFSAWTTAMRVVNETCMNSSPSSVVREGTSFCAPGYAALGHPEWIFAATPPSRLKILSSFIPAVNKLAASLPRYVQPIQNDEESQRIVGRKGAESVCNSCAGELLVGRNPDWKDRVDEFYDDEEIDWTEYREIVMKYFLTCAKMIGYEMKWKEKQQFWKMLGLDRQKRI